MPPEYTKEMILADVELVCRQIKNSITKYLTDPSLMVKDGNVSERSKLGLRIICGFPQDEQHTIEKIGCPSYLVSKEVIELLAGRELKPGESVEI